MKTKRSGFGKVWIEPFESAQRQVGLGEKVLEFACELDWRLWRQGAGMNAR